MKKSTFLFTAVATGLLLTYCGDNTESDDSSSTVRTEQNECDSSDSFSSLSQYAGTWELFQVGDGPTESATFTVKIRSNGSASISHVAHIGYSDTWIESGDGEAALNGSALTVTITSGKSRGTTLRLLARGGQLYTADGESFSKR